MDFKTAVVAVKAMAAEKWADEYAVREIGNDIQIFHPDSQHVVITYTFRDGKIFYGTYDATEEFKYFEFDFSSQSTKSILDGVQLFTNPVYPMDRAMLVGYTEEARKRLGTVQNLWAFAREYNGTPHGNAVTPSGNHYSDIEFPDMLTAAQFATAVRRYVGHVGIRDEKIGQTPFGPFTLFVSDI